MRFPWQHSASSPVPPANVMAPVATPPIFAQLGYVRVAGLWDETNPAAAARWRTRRTARARWRSHQDTHRGNWEGKGPK